MYNGIDRGVRQETRFQYSIDGARHSRVWDRAGECGRGRNRRDPIWRLRMYHPTPVHPHHILIDVDIPCFRSGKFPNDTALTADCQRSCEATLWQRWNVSPQRWISHYPGSHHERRTWRSLSLAKSRGELVLQPRLTTGILPWRSRSQSRDTTNAYPSQRSLTSSYS